MPNIISRKYLNGRRNVGSRGIQGISGNDGFWGPQGIPLEGYLGDIGNPGPTCACRLDQDVQDTRNTGAQNSDYLSYNSTLTSWENVPANQISLANIDFSNIPRFTSATGAYMALGIGKLFLIDGNKIKVTVPL